MIKSIVCFMLILVSVSSFTQQNKSSITLTKQDYLQKSKRQKTTAWILAGAGAFSLSLGTVKFNFAGSDGEVDNSNSSVLLVTGLAAIGVSIPLFIASGKNKKKSMGMSFKMQPVQQLQKNYFVSQTIPSLKLKFSL